MKHHRVLAQAIHDRRIGLGLTIAAAVEAARTGISIPAWSKIENGHAGNYRDTTLAAINRALRWPQGTAEDALETGKLPVIPPDDQAVDVDVLAEVRDGVRAMILQTSRQEAQLGEVVGLVRRLDEQVGELADRMSLLERRRGSSGGGAPSEPHATGQGHLR